MHHFAYRNGVLHAEAVNLVDLAQAVATPFYCYSTATLTRHYEVFADAFADVKALICYAMKANSNQAVIKTLAALGAGADVVSGGELKRARGAGIAPERRIRGRAAASVIDRQGQRPHRSCLGSRQSRHRPQDPRQDRDRQG
jgi:diaminopimelate decarboxylase